MTSKGRTSQPEHLPTDGSVDPSGVDLDGVSPALTWAFWGIFALFAVALLVLPLRLMMEIWDESRNANNAIEMALRGHWLTPTYGFQVDHWNTKPPLLIWIVAALERLRVPLIAALRLPSELAALATIVIVYRFCRWTLHRPFAGLCAALLMMASTLYIGPHVAMTGDYDALLCLWTTIYALGFFAYVEDIAPGRAIAIAAVALALAILTKSIAGILLLPGLFVYAVLRGRLLRILVDKRLWLALLGAAAVVSLYYLGRNVVDPGYTHIVWKNELGGRFASTNEQHTLPLGGYLRVLLGEFEPGFLLIPAGLLAFRLRDSRSRAAALFVFATAGVFLALISASKTQIFYYCAPAVPLLSVLVALGLSGLVALASRWRAWRPRVLQGVVAAGLVTAFCVTTYVGRRFVNHPDRLSWVSYGQVLRAMRPEVEAAKISAPVYLVDPGIETNAHFHAYDPVAQYYAHEATLEGMPTERVAGLGSVPNGAWVATCDPATVAQVSGLPGARRLMPLNGLECVWARR